MNRYRSNAWCLPLAALFALNASTSAVIVPACSAAVLLGCLTAALPADAVAAAPPEAGLAAGMGYSDVIQLKGPATSKEELETKREDLWTYPGIVLTFHEGRLVKWRRTAGENLLMYAVPPKALAASTAVQVAPAVPALAPVTEGLDPIAKPKNRARVAGLISEIMKELPSDDGPSGGASQAQPMGMLPTDIVRAPR